MESNRREMVDGVILAGVLLTGYLVAALLGHFIPRSAAKGLGFFIVSIVSYLILGKRRRVGFLAGVGLSILIGLIAFVGELL